MRWSKREAAWGYVLIAPQVAGVLFFSLFPVAFAFVLSFSKWNLIGSPVWVGFRNYIRQFSDPVFWRALLNTVYFTVANIPLSMSIGLGLALFMNRKMLFRAVYRSVFFLPVITSTVAVSLVWLWIYEPDYGLLNGFLFRLGIKGPLWLGSLTWAMPAVIIASVWKIVGYNMVIFLAGLQAIPASMYEVAMLDGAGAWKRFTRITLPLLSPTTFFILVMSIIGSFQVFDQVFIMTRGGPVDATNVLILQVYRLGFQYFKMGEATAVAWVLFIIIMAITLVQFKVSDRWVYYSGR